MHYHSGHALLLVEDEIDIQSFLRRSIEEAGYRTVTASEGRTAERLLVEMNSTFDLVVHLFEQGAGESGSNGNCLCLAFVDAVRRPH